MGDRGPGTRRVTTGQPPRQGVFARQEKQRKKLLRERAELDPQIVKQIDGS